MVNQEDLARAVGHGQRFFRNAKKAVGTAAKGVANDLLGKGTTPNTTTSKFNPGELGYKVGAGIGELLEDIYGDKIPRAQEYGAATKQAVQKGTTAIQGGLERITTQAKALSQSVTERLANDDDRKIEIGKQTYSITDRCVTKGDVARVAGYMIISSRDIPSGVRGRQELIAYVGAQGIYSTLDLKKRENELSPLAKTALSYLK